jgi:aminopeptidase N
MEDGYYIDTIVHEIAHQWFYGLIGNDQIYEPWLDESLASYWQVLYYENAEGEERAEYQLNSFRSWVNRPEDQMAPIGLGIEEYRKVGDYYTIVYFKGALFFDALRSTMGDEIFFDFLRTYYQRYRYGFVDSRGFQDVAEQVCQCDLSQLFSNWVYKGGDVLK